MEEEEERKRSQSSALQKKNSTPGYKRTSGSNDTPAEVKASASLNSRASIKQQRTPKRDHESVDSNASANKVRKRGPKQQQSFAPRSHFNPLSDPQVSERVSERQESPLGYVGETDTTPPPDAMLR